MGDATLLLSLGLPLSFLAGDRGAVDPTLFLLEDDLVKEMIAMASVLDVRCVEIDRMLGRCLELAGVTGWVERIEALSLEL